MTTTSDTHAIQTEIAEAGGCKRRLTITIPGPEVAREFDETVRRFAKAVRVPGFRRGKVPAALVRKRFGKEIEEEVRDHLVRHGLREGFEKNDLFPLHAPVLEGGEVHETEPFRFTALFEVRPKIELGEYRGLRVTVAEPVVSDEDVERALTAIRERLARFVPVEPRPVAVGDFVLVDLAGHFEDGKGKDFAHQGVMIEVGSDQNLPEFESALPGMTVGETRTFPVVYPAEFEAEHLAGKHLLYTLSVKEIKVKDLPAADDELPRDLGKEGNLASFKDEIRRDLLEGRKKGAERQAREAILRQLIEKHPVELPEVMVEEQINLQVEDIIRGMILRGVHPSKADVDWKEVREKEIPLARQRVLGTLILDAIADKEGIDAADSEVETRLVEEARGRGERPDLLRKKLDESGARQAFKNQIVREKSLDFLMKNATITH